MFCERMDIMNFSALALSKAIEKKQVSAAEVMQATLARIDAVNGAVNAIVSLRDADDLMAQARAADDAPRAGWLHGIPLAIKDLTDAEGLPTTLGCSLFKDNVALSDGVLVQRQKAAGGIVIGKTNTPEFGLGSHTFNPVFGATRNPYDATRSCGGSSGGAAVALATGMLAVADGSDMMGSLRNPAGWNNVYGMRPSWGTVPAEPVGDMFLHQLATSGPMARSPRDLAALLDTMTGRHPLDPLGTSPDACLPQMDTAPARLRIGALGDWDGAFPYEDGIAQITQAAVTQMGEMGHRIIQMVAPFNAEAIWESWITLRSFSNAAGLRTLYDDPGKRDHLKEAAQWEIARGLSMDAMEVHDASVIRSDWYRTAARLFAHVDVMVLPSAQIWPFDVTQVHPTEIAGVQMDTYHRWMHVVVPASLLGLPVVNVPVGFGNNGLPAGIQLIGARGSDALLLQLAQEWHAATDWPGARPALA